MMESMNRREAMKKTAWTIGGVVSIPALVSVLESCSSQPELNWTPTFFTEEQAQLIMQIAEGILPEDDSPGARKLGVPAFIERMVSMVYKVPLRMEFMEGLKKFDSECKSIMGKQFVSLSSEKQFEFLNKENQKISGMKFVRGNSDRPFFWRVKELTLTGYYTTEYGVKQALQYLQIPVEYHGCVPRLDAGNGKTWAT